MPQLVGPSGEQFPRELRDSLTRSGTASRSATRTTARRSTCLRQMMGHRTTDTTRGYYKVNKTRMRKAVARVSEMQLNHRGHRVSAPACGELVDAEYDRYQVGQIAVAFGTCHEPSNVKSSGQIVPVSVSLLRLHAFPHRPVVSAGAARAPAAAAGRSRAAERGDRRDARGLGPA